MTWLGKPSAVREDPGSDRERRNGAPLAWSEPSVSCPSLFFPDPSWGGQVQRGPRAAPLKSALPRGGNAARSPPSLLRCARVALGLPPGSRPRSARPACPLPGRPTPSCQRADRGHGAARILALALNSVTLSSYLTSQNRCFPTQWAGANTQSPQTPCGIKWKNGHPDSSSYCPAPSSSDSFFPFLFYVLPSLFCFRCHFWSWAFLGFASPISLRIFFVLFFRFSFSSHVHYCSQRIHQRFVSTF